MEQKQHNELKKMVVCVTAATVWTEPNAPRYIDQLALMNPVNLEGWLSSITTEESLKLCTNNLVQSQVLYGTDVYLLKEQEEWAHVLIPTQPSKKDKRGYPGWIPLRQLTASMLDSVDSNEIAQVTAEKSTLHTSVANLRKKNGAGCMEISFLTRFPVTKQTDEYTEVVTPHGQRFIKTEDVRIFQKEEELHTVNGNDLLETGKMFLDLPYLWGGMTSYGYDCSGFVYSVYRSYGITLPRDASDQVKQGTPITRENLQVGDLLFFAYEKGKGAVHHVGMYAGNDLMIHSPKTGKTVEIIPLTNTKYEEELIGGRRYIS
ncbi:NlpC/P60 family protein [Evansella sp. AB-rgal1]|uniref:C40 family peptidase n=1 Tax=Evansella sp. AB-rgal1 TaxID=3242696 RepID=UPI00359DF656